MIRILIIIMIIVRTGFIDTVCSAFRAGWNSDRPGAYFSPDKRYNKAVSTYSSPAAALQGVKQEYV